MAKENGLELVLPTPSQATMSCHLRSAAIGRLLDDMYVTFVLIFVLAKRWGKNPLPVGSRSKATETRWGHGGRNNYVLRNRKVVS